MPEEVAAAAVALAIGVPPSHGGGGGAGGGGARAAIAGGGPLLADEAVRLLFHARHGGAPRALAPDALRPWLPFAASFRAAGVLSFAHIGDVDQGADMVYSLACFLAGANNASYFAFSSADKTEPPWMECWDGGSPTAPVFPTWCSGQGGSDDYARPLGPPVGPRAPTGRGKGEVARAFASGTRVTVELTGAACEIAWADGHTTTCA